MILFINIGMTVGFLVLGIAYFYQYLENADLKVENELYESQFERIQTENSRLEEVIKLSEIEIEALQELRIEDHFIALSGQTV